MQKVDAALALARRGFRVFPLIPNGKTPAKKSWQTIATTDENKIKSWWDQRDYNIGVATGKGIFVVDYDCKPNQKGEKTLKKHRLLGFDETFRVKTPNGVHAYYATQSVVSNSVSSIAEHVDVRGDGGYVVGPGSTIDEKTYTIEDDQAPQYAPTEIERAALRANVAHTKQDTTPLTELDSDHAIAQATDYLEHAAPEAIEGSGGDETTYKVACRVKDYGISEETCFELMEAHWNAQKAIPPWDHDDLQRKIQNAYAYGSLPPGVADARVEFDAITDEQVNPKNQTTPDKKPKLYVVGFNDGTDQALKHAGEPLIKGLLDRGAFSVIYGQSNSGKTFVALDLAYDVATGQQWNGQKTTQGAVLYIAAEGGKGIFKRLKALRLEHSPGEEPKLYTMPCPIDLLRGAGPDSDTGQLISQIQALEARIGQRIELIVIDTLSRALAGGDENSSQDMGTFVKHVDRIRASCKAHLMVVHHSGKDTARGARGWSGIRAAVDTEIEIDEGVLKVTKQRDIDPLKPLGFSLRPVQIGTDTDGDAQTSCVVDLAGVAEFNVPLTDTEAKTLAIVEDYAATQQALPEPVFEYAQRDLIAAVQKATQARDVPTSNAVKKLLDQLGDKNHLVRVRRGVWALPEKPDPLS